MNIPGTYLTLLPRDLQQMINVYISHMNLNLETLIAILSIHFRYLSKDSVDSLIIQVNRIFTDEGLMIRIICKYNHLTKFVGFFTTDVIMNVNLQVQN